MVVGRQGLIIGKVWLFEKMCYKQINENVGPIMYCAIQDVTEAKLA